MKRYYILFGLMFFCLIFSISCLYQGPHNNSPVTLIDSLNQGKTSSERFAIVGNDLCAVSNSTIKIYNIQNPSLPVHLNNTDMGSNVLSLGTYKDSLLVKGDQNGLALYKIIASVPIQRGIFPSSRYYDPFSANANYIFLLQSTGTYVANHYPDFLGLYDIGNISTSKLDFQNNLQYPKDITNDSSNNLFLCDEGLKVFDVSNVPNINLKKHFNIEANSITAYNDNLFIMSNTSLSQYKYSSDTISLLSKINIITTH